MADNLKTPLRTQTSIGSDFSAENHQSHTITRWFVLFCGRAHFRHPLFMSRCSSSSSSLVKICCCSLNRIWGDVEHWSVCRAYKSNSSPFTGITNNKQMKILLVDEAVDTNILLLVPGWEDKIHTTVNRRRHSECDGKSG